MDSRAPAPRPHAPGLAHGAGRSTALGAFALYAHHKRLQMEMMAAAAGRTFNDHQHDGIGPSAPRARP